MPCVDSVKAGLAKIPHTDYAILTHNRKITLADTAAHIVMRIDLHRPDTK